MGATGTVQIVVGDAAQPHPARPVGAVLISLAAALLASVLVVGGAGERPPEHVVDQFVAAMSHGDVDDVIALLHDDPTIVTWVTTMPSTRDASTMTLLDVGLADRVVTADAYPLPGYHEFTRSIGNRTDVAGCEPRPRRTARQAMLYDAWIECRFSATNDLTEILTGGRGTQRGTIGFGIADQRVRAVLVHSGPLQAHAALGDFFRWMWQQHPDDFERWMRGRFQHPVFSEESAVALRALAVGFVGAA